MKIFVFAQQCFLMVTVSDLTSLDLVLIVFRVNMLSSVNVSGLSLIVKYLYFLATWSTKKPTVRAQCSSDVYMFNKQVLISTYYSTALSSISSCFCLRLINVSGSDKDFPKV